MGEGDYAIQASGKRVSAMGKKATPVVERRREVGEEVVEVVGDRVGVVEVEVEAQQVVEVVGGELRRLEENRNR